MTKKEIRVSIPFKRESASKEFDEQWHEDVEPSFNSLQTGKCIERGYCCCSPHHRHEVSIPFKRESASKVDITPSAANQLIVSIPFKRESASKVPLLRF